MTLSYNKKGQKFINLMIGAVVFIGFVVFMFTFAAELTTTYGADVSGNFTALAAEYNQLDDFAGADSTIRAIDNETQFGDTAGQDVSSFFISGSLSAARLITNVAPTFSTLITLVATDLSTLVNPIIVDVIAAILIIFTIVLVFTVIARIKAEV